MLFFRHLARVKMSYYSHLKRSWGLGIQLYKTGTQSFIHGIYPDVYTEGVTTKVLKLYRQFLKEGVYNNTKK